MGREPGEFTDRPGPDLRFGDIARHLVFGNSVNAVLGLGRDRGQFVDLGIGQFGMHDPYTLVDRLAKILASLGDQSQCVVQQFS